MNLLFKQVVQGTLLTFIGAGIGFVITFFIATYFLSPTEVGLVRLLTEVATLVGSFALLATQSSAIRYYPYLKTEDSSDNGFGRLLLMIPLLGFAFFSGLYLLFRDSLIDYFSEEKNRFLLSQYYYTVLPLMLSIMYLTIFEVYCSINKRVALPRLFREVLLRLTIGGCYVAFGVGVIGFDGMIWGVVIAHLIVTVACAYYAISLRPKPFKAKIILPAKHVRKDFLSYTALTLLSALGSNLIARIDLLMVSAYLGLQHGGVYSIALFIVAVLDMPSRSIVAISSPLLSRSIHDNDWGQASQLYHRVSTQQYLVGMILFILIWCNIDLLFTLIPHTETYATGKYVIFFLGIGKLLDLSFSFGNALLRYSVHYKWSLFYSILLAIFTILLNLILIPFWGINGAAIASLITYILGFTFQQYLLKRKLQIPLVTAERIRLLCITALLLLFIFLMQKVGLPIISQNFILFILGYCMLRKSISFQHLVQQTLESLNRLNRQR